MALGPPPAPAKLYVPARFKGLRHLPMDSRHWGVTSEVPLCSKRGGAPVAEYSLDYTGRGPICGRCVLLAERGFGVADAEDFIEGKTL